MKSFVESLESRRCLSATVHHAILAPSAVEGNYVGTATYDGITKDLKLTITATSAKLTVVGIGTKTVTLTTKEFNAIRKGSIDDSGTSHGYTYTIDGAFNSTGTMIHGSASIKAFLLSASGTAQLHKIST